MLTPQGKVEKNVYILLSGRVRGTYTNETREVTDGFAGPGTFLLNIYGYFAREDSPMLIETLSDTELLQIPSEKIKELARTDLRFAGWLLKFFQHLLYHDLEKRMFMSNVTANAYRYIKKNFRSHLFQDVSAKVMASYLNITEQSYSRLRAQILREEKGK